MNEKTKYSRVAKDRQTNRMKTPEMLYQQLDRITDYRFCQRDKYTEEERKILVAWGKKMHAIVKRYIANIYAMAGVEDMAKCDCKRSNDIFRNYYVSTEEYMNYKRNRINKQTNMEKNNYYLEITANGTPVSNDVLPESFRHFYCVTDEQIKFVTIGLVIGLRARYKKPKIEVYKEKTDGEYKYCSTYQ